METAKKHVSIAWINSSTAYSTVEEDLSIGPYTRDRSERKKIEPQNKIHLVDIGVDKLQKKALKSKQMFDPCRLLPSLNKSNRCKAF